MWLVVGNKYIQLSNGLEEVAELDEVGGLTISKGEGVRYKGERSGPYAYMIFSVFISSISEGWKAKSTLQPESWETFSKASLISNFS